MSEATPDAPLAIAEVVPHPALAVVERLDSIANLLTGLGTAADKGKQGRPDLKRRALHLAELRCLYRYNGYARRYVDIVPDDATRKGWKVLADDGIVDVMESEDKRLGISGKVADVHRWGRLDGGAALLLVTDDEATRSGDPNALATPLDLDTVTAVHNVVVLDGREIQPFTFGADPRDPNFRKPATWTITPGGRMVTTGLAASSVEVHTSRLIYFPGQKVPESDRFNSNGGLDDSVIEAAWDHIRNLTTTDQGGAILAQELKTDTLKVQGLAALATSDEQLDFYEMKIRTLKQAQSMLNMRILDSGDEYISEAANVTGYKDLSEGARIALSAVTGIPQVILFGDSPGGLNADGASARTIWDRSIAAVQETIYRARLERLYEVLFAADDGPTGGTVPESWRLEFEPLDEPDAATEATTRKTIAETDAIYIDKSVLDPEDVTESRFGEKGYQTEIQPVTAEAGATFEDLADLVDEVEVEEPPEVEPEVEVEIDPEEGVDEAAPEVDEAAPEVDDAPASASALTGVQVTSAKSVVADVAARLLPRESGIAMLESFFNLPNAEAERVMGTVGTSFFTKPEAADDQVEDEAPPDTDTDTDTEVDDAGEDETADDVVEV